MRSMRSKINLHVFTRRETAILLLMAEGYRDKEIADELYISEKMVRENKVNLMRKLDAPSVSSVIDHALMTGSISVYEVLRRRFQKGKSGINWIAGNR